MLLQLIVVIDRAVEQLSAFTLDEIRLGIHPYDLIDRAPFFQATFSSLGEAMTMDRTKLIKRNARLEKMAQQPLANASTSSPAFQDEPKTPDQPTHPSDPKYSGSSTESKPEGTPNTLILDFLKECIHSFAGAMRELTWPQTQTIVRIGFLYTPEVGQTNFTDDRFVSNFNLGRRRSPL